MVLPRKVLQKAVKDVTSLSFVRSSGPGGQNVNKVNTCAQARLSLPKFFDKIANQINSSNFEVKLEPKEYFDGVLERIRVKHPSKVTKRDELIVRCEEERYQERNKVIALERITTLLTDVLVPPKEREVWETIGKKGKEIRKKIKTFRKDKKMSRRKDW